MHFVGMLLAAALFTIGITMFIITFFRHGLPSDEAVGADVAGDAAWASAKS
jgi:nitric oxide reductase subunit B